MENQSKGSGTELQRWFESEAETARDIGVGAWGLSAPSCQEGWKPGPVSFHSLGKAGPVCLGSQIMAGLWFKFGSSVGPPS